MQLFLRTTEVIFFSTANAFFCTKILILWIFFCDLLVLKVLSKNAVSSFSNLYKDSENFYFKWTNVQWGKSSNQLAGQKFEFLTSFLHFHLYPQQLREKN